MKEKKRNTTTGFGNVVVNDNEALIRRLLDFYNNNTTLKTVFSLSDYERNCLITLNQLYGEERIREGFCRADASDFLSGRKGCDWSPDFRWIVTLRNFENILNGKYDDFRYGQGCLNAPSPTAANSMQNNAQNNTQNNSQNTSQKYGYSGYSRVRPPEVSVSSIPDGDEFWEAALARGFSDLLNDE